MSEPHVCACRTDVYPFRCEKWQRDQVCQTHAICSGRFRASQQSVYFDLWRREAAGFKGIPVYPTRLQRLSRLVNRLGLAKWKLGDKLADAIHWATRGKLKKCVPCQQRQAALNGDAPQPAESKPVVTPAAAIVSAEPPVVPPAAAKPTALHRTTLTVGTAVCDDFDGAYFSIQHLRLCEPDLMDRVEFLIVDNRPDSAEGKALRRLIQGDDGHGGVHGDGKGWIPNARYLAAGDVAGTAAPRDRVFQDAKTDAVLCMDAHVLLEPGALRRLLDYYDAHPQTVDLLQGPMLDDHLPHVHATHMNAEWGTDRMFGVWGNDHELHDPDAPPKEIPMHGLGLFSCRKAAWPGFNPEFRGFGGEEGYLHKKVRAAGGRTLCLPFLRWLHRFPRPRGTPYANRIEDRCRNYLIGARELGEPIEPIVERFREVIHADRLARLIEELPAVAPRVRVVPPAGPASAAAPLVSCLMATHGRVDQVAEAVACFVQQDYPNRELVILNNHPTPLVIDQPNVRVINEPGHPTLGHCRNRLLELAEGDYVRTWDDDDLYLPWSISQGVAHIGAAVAWKPSRSWFTSGGARYELRGNAMEASILCRADVARQFRYAETGGDEHKTLLAGLGDGLKSRELGPWTGYCYRWGLGMHHISGSLGSRTIEERTADWIENNQNAGDGSPIVPVDMSAWWERIAAHAGDDIRAEWLAQALRQPPADLTLSAKSEQITRILDRLFPGRKNLVAAELGRLRNATDVGREGDGWSTWQLARDPRVRLVYSIDPRADTIDACRQVIDDPEQFAKIIFRHAIADPAADVEAPIDLLYVDTTDDPVVNLQAFLSLAGRLSNIAAVAVDDWSKGKKHLLIQRLLEPTHASFVIGDAIVFTRRQPPAWQQGFAA